MTRITRITPAWGRAVAVLPPNLLPFARALSLASNGLRVSREPNDDGTRPAAGQALKTRAPAGLTTDERARLPQPHNEAATSMMMVGTNRS